VGEFQCACELDETEHVCYHIDMMPLIVQVKLLTTPEQAQALGRTPEISNTACIIVAQEVRLGRRC
jgi:hypothetical protein